MYIIVAGLDCGSSSGSTTHVDENNDANHKGAAHNHLDMTQHHNYKVPHMEQWLALRVHGGARSWPKLPSCFNTGEP